jgi:iron complex transport system substrate-binding protein
MTQLGNGQKPALHFTQAPQRVVSLVPSLTESLFDLGFGPAVVGITDYCIHPANSLHDIPRLGGTKNPDINQIFTLNPDLVLANQEENPRKVVETLEQAGLKVWLTFPKTIRQSIDVLWTLVGIFRNQTAAARLETLEIALDWAESSLEERNKWRYFCPIWKEPVNSGAKPEWWMTFNQNTYISDLLRLMGGENIFAQRKRSYPLEADLGRMLADDPGDRDQRYPRVTTEEILQAKPEVILLPSEPYAFEEQDMDRICEVLAQTQAVKQEKVCLVDGSMLTWHGTRLAKALNELPVLFENF